MDNVIDIVSFIDELLTYSTGIELNSELGIDKEVFNRAINSILVNRPGRDEPGKMQEIWLNTLVKTQHKRDWLISIINLRDDDSFRMAIERPEYLDLETYNIIEESIGINRYNSKAQSRLLHKKAVLAKAAAHLMIYSFDSKLAINLYRNGINWLKLYSAKGYFSKIARTEKMYKEHIANIKLDIVKIIKGNENDVIGKFELETILNSLANSQGLAYIESLKQGILITEKNLNVWGGEWAILQFLYGKYLLNDESINKKDYLEESYVHFKLSLAICTRKNNPDLWSDNQIVLGKYYRATLIGSRADNIDKAISRFYTALLEKKRDKFPIIWASIHTMLGIAYGDRIKGNRIDNLKEAVICFNAALEVYSITEFEREWGATKYNLGIAQRMLLNETKLINTDADVQVLTESLIVRTREEHPKLWADTQAQLGEAYLNRVRGEQAENIELAIKSYQNALDIYKPEHNPKEWASAQEKLGSAFAHRLREDRVSNIEQAINAYKQALTIYTREKYAADWAHTLMSLGIEYREYQYALLKGEELVRAQEDPRLDVEDTIHSIRSALRVYNFIDYPDNWARAKTNLGSAYSEREYGVRSENLELSIKYHKQALRVYNQQEHPEQWAMTHLNLGSVYKRRLYGKHDENILLAIDSYNKALLVYSDEYYMDYLLVAAGLLGALLYREERWGEAKDTFIKAHNALSTLRNDTIREESRRKLAQDNIGLYNYLIPCLIKLGDYEEAASYAMSSKALSLVELIASDKSPFNQLLNESSQFKQEWEPLNKLQEELNSALSNESEIAFQDVNRLSYEIVSRTDSLLFNHPGLASVKRLPLINASQVRVLSSRLGGVPLIEYVGHKEGYGAFVMTMDDIKYVPLFERTEISDSLLDALQELVSEDFWFEEKNGKAILRDRTEMLIEMYEAFFSPILNYLPSQAKSLVISPSGIFNFVPFQALLNKKGENLSEKFAMTFVPSISTLQVLYEQSQLQDSERASGTQRLLSIVSPGPINYYLKGAFPEANAVSKHFTSVIQLDNSEAVPERIFSEIIKPFEVIHIICHAVINRLNPFDSALMLERGTRVTINDIRLRVQLKGRPVVTLSACETGLSNMERGDENVGFIQAFLAAGASTVVASKWPVNDSATQKLFEAFYQIRRSPGVSDAEAMQKTMHQIKNENNVFSNPYFWAAFQVNGLPAPVTRY